MTNCSISTIAITCDQYADYVPFVSTVTNIIDLIAKVVLAILEKCCPSCYAEIASYPSWVDYVVNQKDVATCLKLAIPLFNIYVAIPLAQARQQARVEHGRRMLMVQVARMQEGNYRRFISPMLPIADKVIAACPDTLEGRKERASFEVIRDLLRAEPVWMEDARRVFRAEPVWMADRVYSSRLSSF